MADFKNDTEYSKSLDKINGKLIRKLYPEATSIRLNKVTGNDKGIDFIVKHGKEIKNIDVKNYRKNDGYVFLEYFSVIGQGNNTEKPGWTVDPNKLTDEVLFVNNNGNYILVDFKKLMQWTVENNHLWDMKNSIISRITNTNTSLNGNIYYSMAYKIPHELLIESVGYESMGHISKLRSLLKKAAMEAKARRKAK